MPEEEVLYSNVRFIKAKRETSERASPSTNPTFSEVNISRTQPSTTEVPELPQRAELSRKSKLPSERVVLLVVSALLAAAVIALCVTSLKPEHHKWGKKPNKETKPCSTVQPTCPDVKNQTSYKCEEGWVEHGGKCYYFSVSKTFWNESSDECRAKKGYLVKIDSTEEQRFLERKVKEIKKSDDKFWIGLKYSAENDRWLWTDESPLNESLTFWSNKEQDNKNGTKRENPGGQSCLRVVGKGGAHDLKLTFSKTRQKSICEKPLINERCKCATV